MRASRSSRARLRPWTRAGVDALVAGPRPKREVMAIAMDQVPPGLALRQFESKAHPGNKRHLTEEHKMVSGARWIVIKNIQSLIIRQAILTFEQDGEEWYELSDRGRRFVAQ